MALRALGSRLPKVTRPTLARYGTAYATLIAEWANAVGPALAEQSLPERLAKPRGKDAEPGGVLTVRVASGGAALEMQHQHQQVIERLNSYLGFRAVARLVIRQAPLPPAALPPVPPPRRTLPADARQDVADTLAPIGDPDLKAALERLGHALKSR